jgi:hypothetical protein
MSNDTMTHMEELKDVGKLLEALSFRCPERTKHLVDKLSPTWKKKLNESLLITTARLLHDADFDPMMYLRD